MRRALYRLRSLSMLGDVSFLADIRNMHDECNAYVTRSKRDHVKGKKPCHMEYIHVFVFTFVYMFLHHILALSFQIPGSVSSLMKQGKSVRNHLIYIF